MDQILNAIITIICLVITGILIPLIKAKIGQEKFNQIRQFTEIAVRSAEQLYTPEEWKEKKQKGKNHCCLSGCRFPFSS